MRKDDPFIEKKYSLYTGAGIFATKENGESYRYNFEGQKMFKGNRNIDGKLTLNTNRKPSNHKQLA